METLISPTLLLYFTIEILINLKKKTRFEYIDQITNLVPCIWRITLEHLCFFYLCAFSKMMAIHNVTFQDWLAHPSQIITLETKCMLVVERH